MRAVLTVPFSASRHVLRRKKTLRFRPPACPHARFRKASAAGPLRLQNAGERRRAQKSLETKSKLVRAAFCSKRRSSIFSSGVSLPVKMASHVSTISMMTG